MDRLFCAVHKLSSIDIFLVSCEYDTHYQTLHTRFDFNDISGSHVYIYVALAVLNSIPSNLFLNLIEHTPRAT